MPPTHLAVTDAQIWKPNKRDVLFFDHIVVGGLDAVLSEAPDPALRADWEFLVSESVVMQYAYEMSGRTGTLQLEGRSVAEVDLDEDSGRGVPDTVEEQAAVAALAALYASIRQDRPPTPGELDVLARRLNVGPAVDLHSVAHKSAQLLAGFHQASEGSVTMEAVLTMAGPILKKATVRSTASRLGSLSQYTAVSLIPYPGQEHLFLGPTTVADVVDLVLPSLPLPDDRTPWEAILDFRRDDETRKQLDRLRRWTRDAARRLLEGEATVQSIDDELASLTESYREHMKLHDLKASTSVFETVLTLAGEVTENVLKVRLKALAKSLFQLRHNRIALMEEELKAPGREVAYIVNAANRFGNQRQ